MSRKTVQVHLNRLCNLSCRHCYSMSGPSEREALDVAEVTRFLAEARDQGYEVAAFSGGEPFLYPRFAEVLAVAHDLGLHRIAVTNGTVLTTRRAALLPLLDLVAISVDGPPPVHDALRGSATAFARMLAGLGVIRRSGLRFGIAHTVTRASLPHLPWMATFAAREGAEVLQLHPLGMVGAAEGMAMDRLDGETLARTYLAATALRAAPDMPAIQIDLFNRARLRAMPELVVPPPPGEMAASRLADIINPLVLMSNGDVSPICHAMHPRFRLGNIRARSLGAMTMSYMSGGLPALRSLCSHLLGGLLAEEDAWPYLNWYELLEHASHANAS